jgi:septal ring factor EnvC (AmiA/AmiB activator)
MDPGGGRDPEDPREGDRPWLGGRSRDLGDRVSSVEKDVGVVQAEFRHMTRGIDQLSRALEQLSRERREVGDGLRADIDKMAKEMRGDLQALDRRLESFEDDRKFKRRMLAYGAWVGGAVAVLWQVGSNIGPWLLALLRGGES